MLSKWLFQARKISRRLWVRTALISALAFVSAALAPLAEPVLPQLLVGSIDVEAARSLLDILANSMLAVTTFSLTVMVTAHFAAQNQATPRAHRLLREDTRTQTVLATFLGAFVYALTSIVFLQLGIHSGKGLVILYAVTLFVIALVILAILRWVDHLSSLGSLEETARRVEEAARAAIHRRLRNPFLGAQPLYDADSIADDAIPVTSPRFGYVQHVDAQRIGSVLEELGAAGSLRVLPGDWVNAGDPVLTIERGEVDEKRKAQLIACVTMGDLRTYEQDPEFGVTVLTEIALRALSPAMNDPRTAIAMIHRIVRVFDGLASERPSEATAAVSRLRVPPMDLHRLLDATFAPIAREGANCLEVGLNVQQALMTLAERSDGEVAAAAGNVARFALAHAERALALESDRERLRAGASQAAYAQRVSR